MNIEIAYTRTYTAPSEPKLHRERRIDLPGAPDTVIAQGWADDGQEFQCVLLLEHGAALTPDLTNCLYLGLMRGINQHNNEVYLGKGKYPWHFNHST